MAAQTLGKIHLPHFVHGDFAASSETVILWGRACIITWVAPRCLSPCITALLCAVQTCCYCQMDWCTIKEEQGFGGHTKTLGEGSDEGTLISVPSSCFGKLRTLSDLHLCRH